MIIEPTEAERTLIGAAREGRPANYSSGDPTQDDPANGDNWPDDRTIRAEIICQLLTGSEQSLEVHYKGVNIIGAKIVGQLYLGGATLNSRLALIGCRIEECPNLTDAIAPSITLMGSYLRGGLAAERLSVRGSLFLESITAKAEVRLLGATISGQLKCRGSHFSGGKDPALNADGVTVAGGIFLDKGFKADGEVRLLRARVEGELNCRGGKFQNPRAASLIADGAIVAGGVFLDREFDTNDRPVGPPFIANGGVRFLHAQITSQFSCSGGLFENPDGHALSADGAIIKGGVFLNRSFTAQGEVDLVGTKVMADLDCSGAHLVNQGIALNLNGIEVGGNIALNESFAAKGQVSLIGAKVSGQLACQGATLDDPEGMAFVADHIMVKGSVFLDQGFQAVGEVRLLGAQIKGQLACRHGTFKNPNRVSLGGDAAIINDSVLLDQSFTAVGEVRFVSAHIGRDFSCKGGRFSTLSLQRATIDGTLSLEKPKDDLDLQHAHVGTLTDDRDSWPSSGRIHFAGFEYQAFAPSAPSDANSRLHWLRLTPQEHLSTQPYEQLEKVLRSSGDERGARAVYIEKRRTVRKTLGAAGRAWDCFLDWS